MAQRLNANRRGVGPPRKYLPRKKIPADLRSLARGHTELCIKVLAGIVSQEAVPAAARVSAAGILLDRGWGKAPQALSGEDGGSIQVIIRSIADTTEESEPLLIEHETQTRD
jgi:hypothetical protein